MVDAEERSTFNEATPNSAAMIWNDVGDPGLDSFHTAIEDPPSFELEIPRRQRKRRGTGTSGTSLRSNDRNTFISGDGDALAWEERSEFSGTESSMCSSRRNTMIFSSESGRQADSDHDRCRNLQPVLETPSARKNDDDQPGFVEGLPQKSATPSGCTEDTAACANRAPGKRLLSL